MFIEVAQGLTRAEAEAKAATIPGAYICIPLINNLYHVRKPHPLAANAQKRFVWAAK